MASPVYNVITPLSWLKLHVRDADNKWLSDAQYQRYIGEAMYGTVAPFVFLKNQTNWYRNYYFGQGDPSALILFQDSTTPFTGEDNCTYEVSCTGVIQVSSGTATASSITANGVIIDLTILMPIVLDTLMVMASQLTSSSSGGSSRDNSQRMKQLKEMAATWRGII